MDGNDAVVDDLYLDGRWMSSMRNRARTQTRWSKWCPFSPKGPLDVKVPAAVQGIDRKERIRWHGRALAAFMIRL